MSNWLKCTPTEGIEGISNILFEVLEENIGRNTRSKEIVISTDERNEYPEDTKTVVITQMGFPAFVSGMTDEFEFGEDINGYTIVTNKNNTELSGDGVIFGFSGGTNCESLAINIPNESKDYCNFNLSGGFIVDGIDGETENGSNFYGDPGGISPFNWSHIFHIKENPEDYKRTVNFNIIGSNCPDKRNWLRFSLTQAKGHPLTYARLLELRDNNEKYDYTINFENGVKSYKLPNSGNVRLNNKYAGSIAVGIANNEDIYITSRENTRSIVIENGENGVEYSDCNGGILCYNIRNERFYEESSDTPLKRWRTPFVQEKNEEGDITFTSWANESGTTTNETAKAIAVYNNSRGSKKTDGIFLGFKNMDEIVQCTSTSYMVIGTIDESPETKGINCLEALDKNMLFFSTGGTEISIFDVDSKSIVSTIDINDLIPDSNLTNISDMSYLSSDTTNGELWLLDAENGYVYRIEFNNSGGYNFTYVSKIILSEIIKNQLPIGLSIRHSDVINNLIIACKGDTTTNNCVMLYDISLRKMEKVI